MRQTLLSLILISCALGFQVLEASPLTQAAAKYDGDISHKTMLDYLRPILRSSGKTARIYYLGSCRKMDDYYVVSFPAIRVQAPLRSDTGLLAVRDVFRSTRDMNISEGADGIIRIVIGKLPTTILDTKIPVISFNQPQQYTEDLALWRIQGSKEVENARQKMDIHSSGPLLRTSLAVEPADGIPHLPTSMSNLTLDQALDSIAKTFGDIVFYGACTEPRTYTIYYVPVNS